MAGLEVTADDVEKEDDKENSESFSKGIKDDTEGAGVVSDISGLVGDVHDGNWAEGLLDGASAAASIADFAEDPLAGLLSAGFGWMMEHLSFLKEPLDWLTGDQDAIKASSQTWGNVAKELDAAGKQLQDTVKTDTAPWKGPAVDAYKPVALGHATLVKGASMAAEGASTVVSMCGTVLEVVRGIVRDLISKAVGDIVACLLEWAAAEVLSFGLATPGMIGDAVRRGLQWAERIMKWVKKITSVFKKAEGLLSKLKDLLKKLEPLMKKLRESKVGKAVEENAGKLANSKFGKAVKKAHEPYELKEGEEGISRSVRHTYAKDPGYDDAGNLVHAHSKVEWPKFDPDTMGKEAVNKFAEDTPKKFAEKGAESFDDNVLNGDDKKDEDKGAKSGG